MPYCISWDTLFQANFKLSIVKRLNFFRKGRKRAFAYLQPYFNMVKKLIYENVAIYAALKAAGINICLYFNKWELF